MFTGIITDIGRVRDKRPGGDPRFVIETDYDTASIVLGASIAHAGVCLTVIETGPDWYAVQVSAETLGVTTARRWDVGTRLNLERALKLGDELGGHLVSGHVDGLGLLVGREPVGDSLQLEFEAPAALARFIAVKGSIAVDGVSLTVNAVEGRRFAINLIPHSQEKTTLAELGPGDAVNLEIDPLARYVARLAERIAP